MPASMPNPEQERTLTQYRRKDNKDHRKEKETYEKMGKKH
jgi:hypothetical protein